MSKNKVSQAQAKERAQGLLQQPDTMSVLRPSIESTKKGIAAKKHRFVDSMVALLELGLSHFDYEKRVFQACYTESGCDDASVEGEVWNKVTRNVAACRHFIDDRLTESALDFLTAAKPPEKTPKTASHSAMPFTGTANGEEVFLNRTSWCNRRLANWVNALADGERLTRKMLEEKIEAYGLGEFSKLSQDEQDAAKSADLVVERKKVASRVIAHKLAEILGNPPRNATVLGDDADVKKEFNSFLEELAQLTGRTVVTAQWKEQHIEKAKRLAEIEGK